MDTAVFGTIVAEIISSGNESIELRAGGNVCDVSLAVAGLGMKAAAAGMIGDDLLGRAMLQRLSSAGVDTTCVYPTPEAQTHATIVSRESSKPGFTLRTPGVTPLIDGQAFRKSFDLFKRCAWVQIGQLDQMPRLASALPDLLAELHAEAPGTSIALDLDERCDLKLMSQILAHIDLVAIDRSTLVRSVRSVMPKGIIATRLDEQGCGLDDGSQKAKAAACTKSVSDPTIAIHVWFAALMCALRKKLPLEQVCKFANRAAGDWQESGAVKSFQETLERV